MRTVTPGRLTRYLSYSDGDLVKAIAFYETNMRLCESFYTPLQCFEVSLRNVIDHAMSDFYGDDWMRDAPLEPGARTSIARAIEDLRRADKHPTRDGVVAELSLGFWTGMLGPRYDATIWRRALYTAFQVDGRTPARKLAFHRFDTIRRFRNRVAHHEPVIDWDLASIHEQIMEAIGWMCPETASWARGLSRFTGDPDANRRGDDRGSDGRGGPG